MTTEQKSFFGMEPTIEPLVIGDLGSPSKIILSEPVKLDLGVYRGDSGSFRISVKDGSNAPIDVSSATWDADVRTTAPAPTILTTFDIVPVVGDPSSVDVILSSSSSELLVGSCVYDVQMTLFGEVTTVVGGSITVTQDVSRAT